MTLESIAGAAGAWLWDKYGQALTDEMAGAATERWAKFNWGQAAEKYRQRVKELYGTTRILGNPKPVSLEGIFSDAYLLDKPTALRRFELEQLKEMYGGRDVAKPEGQRRSALRLATEQKRLFILGKPGAGKTTFLRYVALQAANGKLDKIPIFVSLKEWSDSGLELMPFLVRQFGICAFPEAQAFIEYILTEGQAMMLFDGLDEVNQEDERRARITIAVNDFSKQYSLSPVLITCRLAATDYTFEHFTYVEMADFDDKQIRLFVGKWFHDNPAKGKKFLEEFEREEHKGLRELAQIPLLLTLLCLAFDETMSFPQRRVELYEEALDALLKKWDSSRNIKRDEIYRKLSLGRKRQMLARIAAETFEQGEYFFRQADLAKRISLYLRKLPPADFDEDVDGEAVLKAIEAQHGLLVERAHKIYSFSHLTFQEYFAAKFIAEDASEGTLARIIEMHLTDRRWREVFLLIASLLPEAEIFFSLALQTAGDLVRHDDKLMTVLHWAVRKAASYEGRSVTLDLDLALNLASARGRTLNPDHDFDLIYDPDFDLNLAFARESTLNCDQASDLDLILNLNCALTRAFALHLNFKLSLALSFVFTINFNFDFNFDLNRTVRRAQELYLTELAQALQSLAVPAETDGTASWATFASQLQAIMIQYRNIGHGWGLSEAQLEQLDQYDQANQLLYDCLQLAYVSDRAGIEARLWSVSVER